MKVLSFTKFLCLVFLCYKLLQCPCDFSVPLLGAILHYLYDFAFEWHEDGGDYTVTNYEVGLA